MSDDDLSVTLMPVSFFQHSIDCREIVQIEPTAISMEALGRRLAVARYRLPDLAPFCGEVSFAEVFLGWHREGLALHVAVHQPFRRASYPELSRGDSIELLIDTRDLKTSGYNTRFCHHFFCFAEPLDGRQVGEITHFRSEEDSHPFADEALFRVASDLDHHAYTLTLFISASALVGYDPAAFDRFGFTYRINRTGGSPQHFSAVSSEFLLEQQPSLWGSLHLVQ